MVKTKLAKAKHYAFVDRSPELKPRKTITKSATPGRAKMRTPGSEDKDRQTDRTVESKIGVKEEYDQECDEITMPKIEDDPVKIAPMEAETADEMWERAKWQCYYSYLKTLLKTDPVLKILRPKMVGPLNKPISIPSPATSKLGTIDLILQMLNDTGFCPNAFEGDNRMGCSLEQLKNAISEFVEVMILLVGKASAPRDKITVSSDRLREHSGSTSQDIPTMPHLTLISSQTGPSPLAGCL